MDLFRTPNLFPGHVQYMNDLVYGLIYNIHTLMAQDGQIPCKSLNHVLYTSPNGIDLSNEIQNLVTN